LLLSTVFPTKATWPSALPRRAGISKRFEVLVEGHEQGMGLGEVLFSLRAIVNRDEVAHVPFIPLDRSEQEALEASAEAVKQHIAASEGSR
jgi:malate/lactate dehydrogenase